MRTARAIIVTMVVGTTIALTASPALAAAPVNDVFAGAAPIGIGPVQVLDTTEATTDATDVEANQVCGAPATDASVWYSYTPAVDGGAIVDVSSSSYTAGVIVATGAPGSLSLVACGPGAVIFGATGGTAYSILAFDDQFDGGGNGGTLRISVSEAPPPPTVALTIDPTGRVDARTGTASLTGTFTCTDADILGIFGDLTQRVGRGTVNGFFEFFTDGACDGTAHRWAAEVPAVNGKFAGGKSAAFSFTFACGAFQCSEGFAEQAVQLRGGKR